MKVTFIKLLDFNKFTMIAPNRYTTIKDAFNEFMDFTMVINIDLLIITLVTNMKNKMTIPLCIVQVKRILSIYFYDMPMNSFL